MTFYGDRFRRPFPGTCEESRGWIWEPLWTVPRPPFSIDDRSFLQHVEKGFFGLFFKAKSKIFDSKAMQTVQYIIKKQKISSRCRTSSYMSSKVINFAPHKPSLGAPNQGRNWCSVPSAINPVFWAVLESVGRRI